MDAPIILLVIISTFYDLLLCDKTFWTSLPLPAGHVPYFWRNNPLLRRKCQEDSDCPFKNFVTDDRCWGYEDKCEIKSRLGFPKCTGDSRGWRKTKEEQVDTFWRQGDFGYILERREELRTFCKPNSPEDSSLECSKFFRFCRAKNLYMDFTKVDFEKEHNRYREDFFMNAGELGGHCDVDLAAIKQEGEHKSPLQSWFAELERYSSLTFRPVEKPFCDIIIDKPTFLIKLDAGVNLYHHFCDFVNIYASQHINNSFSTDVNIIMWDTSVMHYGDLFEETWKAFSDFPVIHLKDYDGKKVCFKDAVFSLLARMRFGMYYNMPLIPGCHGSSLFKAFSHHVLHRLGIEQDGPLEDKVRITLLSRETKFRNILNEQEISANQKQVDVINHRTFMRGCALLIDAMEAVPGYEVKRVVYNFRRMTFLDQLKITQNSDILIGIHGAGLTHLLFQPDWGVIIELYNCEDPGCYSDLARLRGMEYMTWENPDLVTPEDEGHHPSLGAHAKFTNYSFDVPEYLRLLKKAANYVRNHKDFQARRKLKYSRQSAQKEEL